MKSMALSAFAGAAAALCLFAPAYAQNASFNAATRDSSYQELIQNVNHHSKRHHHYRHGRVCKKLCAHDYSPCDPMSFKRADNRCSERR